MCRLSQYDVVITTYGVIGSEGASYLPVRALKYTVYGKTFEGVVVHKTHYSLENFRGASGPCHYVQYTASDSRGKLS